VRVPVAGPRELREYALDEELPPDTWIMLRDPESAALYYYHTGTGETRWVEEEGLHGAGGDEGVTETKEGEDDGDWEGDGQDSGNSEEEAGSDGEDEEDV
jgi:hypothetical protein